MLKVEGISASYGKFNVLFEISIEVGQKSTVITIGPNGAGKSTLLKVISGLLKPTSGNITLHGERIDDKEPYQIIELGISVVPEGGRIFSELSVYENLKIGTYVKRARKILNRRILEIFSLFPILQERQKQMAGSLSGGERQMLAIARALMSQPTIIMLDEPSCGLSPLVVKNVFKLVDRIKAEGYSILLVEQNVSRALELADYAYLLESGRVQFSGKREDFVQNPYVKKSYLGM